MKSLGQTLFELSRYNEVWTDRQTDGRTDRRTDKVITIGLPHLRWRGPNKRNKKFRAIRIAFDNHVTLTLLLLMGLKTCIRLLNICPAPEFSGVAEELVGVGSPTDTGGVLSRRQ